MIVPKKSLGQHFLHDENIARKIVDSLQDNTLPCIEIGPGMGVLSKYLFEKIEQVYCIETDKEAYQYLQETYTSKKDSFILANFLKYKIEEIVSGDFNAIGNLPYNISSQIFFRFLDNRQHLKEAVCMIQKEVAERIASPPGSKRYGILSVLLQSYFHIEYLFTVNEGVFTPPPKVKSAVIRLVRNDREALNCDEKKFFVLVKAAFNQRRKTLRNSLKAFSFEDNEDIKKLLSQRAEQLSIEEFEFLTANTQ